MQLDENGNNEALSHLITCHIAESLHSRITFAEFMDLVLYHPQYGYYNQKNTKIGGSGDFFTSPHLGADFGELLAEQFVQMWHCLQCPTPFTLVEMGAGQGLIASDVLRYLQTTQPNLLPHLKYMIIERSAILRAEQRQRLQPYIDAGVSVQWRSLDEIAPTSITGCFFSNELVDAFPVHLITKQTGILQEIYVSVESEEQEQQPFKEVIAPLSTSRLTDYFELIGINLTSPYYLDGYRSEVNLAALDWLEQVAHCLQRGYVLTIDYGYPSDRYYHPARSEGTLQCYYRHRYHSDPYQYLGKQDITAHVNFTALEKQGELCGLQTVGFTKQGLFLMALGLGGRIAALSQSDSTDVQTIQNVLRRRDALQTLIDPTGLGNFGVLIQSKAVEQNERLQGLSGELPKRL